ncbi:MAG TPA: aminotransferase class V-fold PLP-dependent enzyme, partial [Bacilli bacterium]|nr:aminotransferase class V-fold PLP-dependent enzyme [Bacilli bacterium]
MTYLYFDQAASSFPKPKVVGESMLEAIEQYGANPGRGGHLLARRAGEVIYGARQKLAKLFDLDDANRVIFYQNATYALNQAIMGLQLQAGNHIITTVFEHNSVRRPLEYLRRTKGIEITYVRADENGQISAKNIEKAITPQTVAIVASHGSNVTGAILPLHEVGKIAYQNQVKFIVDAAQSAGLCSIDMERDHIDALAFPGHKGLLGPQGTAALLIRHSLELMPITFGGTGSFSELIEQPEKLPERFEVGTLNTPGIAGLSAALDVINERGL